jgi:outer membrane protein OmpA-like peptidoglycan-associated protein
MTPHLITFWRFVTLIKLGRLSVGVGVASIVVAMALTSCVKRPFVPVSEGREYGNPKTPLLVSHLPESNHWALARTRHHNFFQKIICFNYPCRKMIGRRKVLKAISFKDFRKRIRKNAKKGVYKKSVPITPVPRQQRDTIRKLVPPLDTTRIVTIKEPSVAPPLLKADSLITLGEFLFATNSFKLKEEHYSQLDLLSKFLLARPTLEVSISGHTDNVGNERHNVTLSMKRAESVAQYLINQGISDGQVIFEGFGSSQPVSDNDTPEGRSKNRRVEILIRNPSKK